MEISALLTRVKEILQDLYGDRLEGIVLYGSEARGEAKPDSDIDLLVLLQGPFSAWKERKKILRALYFLQLEIPDRHLSFMPVNVDEYNREKTPLYSNARQEGIAL